MSNSISINSNKKPSNILDIISLSFQRKVISRKRKDELLLQYQFLLSNLTLSYTHNNSTSLSIRHFSMIMQSCDYILHHCDTHPIYIYLNQFSLQQLYGDGVKHLKNDVEFIKEQLSIIHSFPFQFQNERNLDVIYNQLPRYIKTLSSRDSIFHFHRIKEDLDYPLVDGIPLFHQMYHKKGIDLVIEYLHRYLIEQQFIQLFQNELPSFILLYEKAKGISLHDIHINLFELLLNQWLANQLLYQKDSILLFYQDIKRLRKTLQATDIDICWPTLMQKLFSINSSLCDYVRIHQNIIKKEWMKFITSQYDLLIYEKPIEDILYVSLERAKENHFERYLFDLENMITAQQKLSYIITHHIDVYDMFDLLDHSIFYNGEYISYFESLVPMELCIFLKLLFPEITAFHQTSFISLLNDFEPENEWQYAFYNYLLQLEPITQNQIIETLIKIKFK